MKENTKYAGLGMAGATHMHKMIEHKLYDGLKKKLSRKHLYVTMETNFNDTIRSEERIPDISIWKRIFTNGVDLEYVDPIFTIEVTHTSANDKDSHESIMECFESYPTMQESFLFNYANNKWIRYEKLDNGEIEMLETSKSRLFGFYMNTFVKSLME
ncbi:MAG: hypothetical protein MJZ33_03590 [Paludibacteraceae bacterium]|nr:hypothetical protein [Paludibacteraceae bacterium]